MHGSLQKWFLVPLLFALLTISFPATAQGDITLDNLTVQLWPEFDQPSMLVIYDFTLAGNSSLPVEITLRFPADADIIAVAYAEAGGFLNAPYQGPTAAGEWQTLTVIVDTETSYHIEYYTPLSTEDDRRSYTYIWKGDYPVNSFDVNLKLPIDATDVTTDPPMTQASPAGSDQQFLAWSTNSLSAGEEANIQVAYTKTSNQLSVTNQPLETGTVDESTQGRVSFNNYLPYILGGLGILLILSGGLYFWQSSKGRATPRKRHRTQDTDSIGEEVYCHQCGKRAQPNDRFCRTCGTRLRKET